MNAMNGVLHSPKELMPFCQTSASKKRLKLSKLRDKSDSGVKQESNDDFKDYAETTMNELLGWYGYEKLDTRDTKDLNLRHFTSNNKSSASHHQMMTSKMTSRSSSSSVCSNKSKENSINREESRSALSPFSGSDGGGGVVGTTTADSTGVCRSASPSKTATNTESNSDNGMENKDCCEDNQNIPPGCIVCAWCAKIGMKLFTLRTATGYKAFCSELCFTQCRRASFKKNKICDWCKHVRHTVNYVDFQDGEQQLQFCSNKCLNQYKMNIFCNETKAHLHLNPSLIKESSKVTSISKTSNLITPELWLKDLKNGENEYNSANSFKDSSDSELELELEDSPQPMVSHQNKRKFSEFSKDVNELKPNERQKDIPIKEKSNKETKRIKHSNKSSNSTSRQTSSGKHSKHLTQELVQQNDWSSRDSSDKTSSFHSPSFRPNTRLSPNPPNVPSLRASMVAPNLNIPILNGSSAINPGIRATAPLNSMPPNASSPAQLFPRLAGNMSRGAPLMPSPSFGPRMPSMPNFLGAAQMEMFARMQSSFPNLRLPLPPFGPHHTGFPFTGRPTVNGIHPNGTPLLQPSIQTNGSVPQLYPNCSLLPPMTIMVPYPVPIPIPIPIPVPIIFPVDKETISKNKSENISNKTNMSSNNEVTTSTHHNGSAPMSTVNTSAITTSKVESVISKLVERKTRANSHQNTVDKSLDFRRMSKEDNNIDISGNDSESDNSSESLPQNLVVNRDKRSMDLSIGLGYR